MGPRWPHHGSRNGTIIGPRDSKWAQDGPKMVPKMDSKIGKQIGPKWAHYIMLARFCLARCG